MQGKQSQLRDIMDENGTPRFERGRPSNKKKQAVSAAVDVAKKQKQKPVALEPKKPESIDDLFGEAPAKEPESTSTTMYTTEIKAITDVVRYGLTAQALSGVFDLDPRTVRSRLSNVKPHGTINGAPTWLIRDVARYLTEVRSDVPEKEIRAYLIKTKGAGLPATLQKDFWDAMMKRQKWEEAAGDLWRTEKVMLVLAEAFKKIKTSSLLWVDNLDRTEGITSEQRAILASNVDGLLDDIYMTLVEMQTETETTNNLTDTTREIDT